MLSKVETGSAMPAVATLSRIAAALGTTVSALLSDEEAGGTVVTKATRGSQGFIASEAGYQFRALASQRSDKRMQPLLFEVQRGHEIPPKLKHGGEEFVFVLEGRMRYQVASEQHDLGPGDSIYFDAWQPHGLKPLSARVRFLAVFMDRAESPRRLRKA
jgi:quercetin dioxygenase-like cupin family protein